MSSYQDSPIASQVYQSVKQPLHDSSCNKMYRNGAKHYYTYVDNQNKIDYNSMKLSASPYLGQTRSIIQNLQNNRVNSANTRSTSNKKQSQIINSHFSNIDKKQTLLIKSTNTNSQNKLTQQPSYSTINQRQSTAVSTFLQQSNDNSQSQQLPFTIPQMSQILSGSQLSQSFSRNSQQKYTIGQSAQKSQFLQSMKRKASDDSSDNEQQQFPSEIEQEGANNQNSISPLKKQESIQLDESKAAPSPQYGVYSYSSQKDQEQQNVGNYQKGYQRNGTRQPSQFLNRNGSLDSKLQLNLQSSNLDQHKFHFYKPAPLQKQPKNTDLPPENQGDQQVSIYEESLTMTSLQQSAMIESTKIRERSLGSMNFDIKGTRLTKRLLDLQEPRNIQEEDEEDTLTSCQSGRSDNGIERSQSQQFVAQKNPEFCHKYKKYSCDINQMSPSYIDIDLDVEGRDQNIEEFSPHQKPPSMASINNQQLNRDWNNSKSPKDRRTSAATLSIDYRCAQVSTNETLQSFCNNVKQAAQTLHYPSQDKQMKKAQTQIESPELNEHSEINRERRSSSIGNIADQIPDEPEKTQLLRTFNMTGNRAPVVKLSQINKNNFFSSNGDRYFIPSLLKSFRGEKDKLSTLYKQYFQKMYYNLQINPKLETKYHQMSPVFLPPLPPNKKTIFFDLDETLIHCIDIFTDPQQYQQFTQSNMTTKNSGSISRNSESCNEVFCTIQCSPLEQIQCLFSIRPFAKQILQELAKDFELILLTAARKIYADAVLEKLDPDNKIFSHRFYRECCIEFSIPNPQQQHQGTKKTYLKDLRIFQNRKLENVILVDNSPLSYLNQIPNGIPILDYCNNNKNDDELLHLCSYLKTFINVNDVRESIKHKFLLKQYRAFPSIDSLQNYIIQEHSN